MLSASMYFVIFDNDSLFLESFKDMIVNYYKTNGILVKVTCVYSTEELFYELETNRRPDALFIDVELGKENGIEIVSRIRKKDRFLDVIFVSSYENYYYEAFKQRPIAFLNKPIEQKECEQVLSDIYFDRCIENRVFQIKTPSGIVNEKYADIIYVESDKRYVTFYCAEGQSYKMKEKLNNIENYFKKADVLFLRIHQSILVNFRHIHIYDYQRVVMTNNVELPIAFERRKDIRNLYLNLCFKEK